MASLNEAFSFPLTQSLMKDIENKQINVFGRGSYTTIKTNTYKEPNKHSDLSMYNKTSLKQ